MSQNPLSLKVLEAYTRDVGRGVARIDYDSMDNLGASTGDVIEIKGKRRTVAKCLPLYPSDEGKGIIRIDGLGRNNSGIAIGDAISVKKIKAVQAEKIVVAPLEAIPPIDERYLADALESVPLIKGDNVMVPYFGGRLTFQIIGVTPATDAVLVTQKTVFHIAEKGETLRGVPQVTYEDIGGLTDEIKKVREMIELPLRHPEIFEKLGIEAPKGILLYGPPGTGKTMLAKAVANESNAHFISISGPEIMSKFYGESEARLREIFKEAREKSPSIIFIDEIDSIAPKREEVSGEVDAELYADALSNGWIGGTRQSNRNICHKPTKRYRSSIETVREDLTLFCEHLRSNNEAYDDPFHTDQDISWAIPRNSLFTSSRHLLTSGFSINTSRIPDGVTSLSAF